MPFLLPKEDQNTIETMHKVAGLLMRRLQETLTEEEKEVLEQWLLTQSAGQREFYLNATEWPAIEAALQSYYHIEEKKALEDIWTRIRETTPLTASPSAIRSMKRYWIAAAAAALLLGVVTIGILTNKKNTNNNTIANKTEDVMPASNKATLQLADGSIITLDSTVSGTLTQQQNASVSNNAQGSGILSYNSHDNAAIAYNKITTPKGGQFQVVLPDGTHVWLNAATSLRYPTSFVGKERIVELSGEAYFEVAANPNQQFRVKIAGTQPFDVDVLGTKFNISSYNEDKTNTTTLVQGKVRVSNANKAEILLPEQQAVLTENNLLIKPADLEEALAWKNGLFYFQDGDIKDIMSEISRWYDVEIIYQGTFNQKVVAKIPRTMTLTNVLQILEYTQSAHFRLEGKKVIVTP